MKSHSYLPVILFVLNGCASLHATVFQNIHEGDSKDHLVAVLGQPSTFGASQRMPSATAWYYTKGADTCGFTINEDIVKYIACQTDPNYVNPAANVTGTLLKGAGDGLKSANKDSATCTTYGNSYGGSYSGTTTCH